METLAQLAPFVVIAALFWLLLIRPAQRRQRQAQNVQRAAEPGSEVMLSSGIFGTVTAVDDDTVQLQVAPDTTVKVARAAIARVITEQAEDPDATDERSDDASNPSDGQ